MNQSNKAVILKAFLLLLAISLTYIATNLMYLKYQEFRYNQEKIYIESLNKDINFLKEEAKNGNSTAEFLLGNKYLKGEDVDQNIPEGMKWISKAADNGSRSAKEVLVSYYLNEPSVRNYEKAFPLAKELAERKDASSIDQRILAELYAKGLGVEKNGHLAKHWHDKAVSSQKKEAVLAEKYNYDEL